LREKKGQKASEIRKGLYPFDVVYVKMPVQGELLDSVRKISLETSNNFPTTTLQRKFVAETKISLIEQNFSYSTLGAIYL
jgi:hypothetical protein